MGSGSNESEGWREPAAASETSKVLRAVAGASRPSSRRPAIAVGGWRESITRARDYGARITAKLNNVDLPAWLADVLHRIADHPAGGLNELVPWN